MQLPVGLLGIWVIISHMSWTSCLGNCTNTLERCKKKKRAAENWIVSMMIKLSRKREVREREREEEK